LQQCPTRFRCLPDLGAFSHSGGGTQPIRARGRRHRIVVARCLSCNCGPLGKAPTCGYAVLMGKAKPVLTGEEWVAAANQNDRPPTSDDVTVTLDGRRLDSKEKVLEWLAEIEADRADGRTVADSLG
jgi:hypothetical protein